MSNNYTKMIANGMSCSEEEVSDKCLRITLLDVVYNMAFIDYENEDCLGVNYTANDGTERFVVINKDHIVDVAIIYQQDIDEVDEVDEEFNDVSYQ